ncbi:MAG: hypothetical protein HC813_04075 [Planctomycetes bacterium]|nr:hypothetical protein [Planctomycetota bacterium]
MAGNFCANPVLRRMDAEIASPLPVAERIDRDGLFVGNHHYDLTAELDLLAKALDTI